MAMTNFSYSFSLQMESAASVPTFSTLISDDNSDHQVASLQGKRLHTFFIICNVSISN